VTLDGEPVGGATVDAWRRRDGARCWSARLLLPINEIVRSGLLAGMVLDGRRVSGRVRPDDATENLQLGRSRLVVLHGDGPLTFEAALPG
jgi:hypothetical protein